MLVLLWSQDTTRLHSWNLKTQKQSRSLSVYMQSLWDSLTNKYISYLAETFPWLSSWCDCDLRLCISVIISSKSSTYLWVNPKFCIDPSGTQWSKSLRSLDTWNSENCWRSKEIRNSWVLQIKWPLQKNGLRHTVDLNTVDSNTVQSSIETWLITLQ